MSKASVPKTSESESKEPAEVARISAPKHKWLRVPVYIHRDKTPTNCDETERSCELCDLVKITVHPPDGYAYRAWRGADGVRFIDPGYTPVCEGVGK